MRLWETKFEKGKYVTRVLGLRVWKRPEPALSVQASLLRRELLTKQAVRRRDLLTTMRAAGLQGALMTQAAML